jgi:predicted esterase
MYRSDKSSEVVFELPVSLKFNHRSRYEPHKVTHLHPGEIVSYAVLRPPSSSAACKSNQQSAPVLLQLHGAGLEADNDMVAHALDPLPDLCAWVLFPTGVTTWSADDWHTWGIADVRAAIESIPSWITTTKWNGIGVDVEKWLVSGHSNGGQGTTYIITHWPDNVAAAAPISGYLSIPQYVPYQFWRSMEPKRRAVVDAALNSWRLELMIENAKNIPIHQQHGSKDDNVPVYHSRLMYQLLGEAGSVSDYTELKGSGHWFNGVMTTDNLKNFYESVLENSADNIQEDVFTLIVANPADTGSKNGFKVLHLKDPSQFGRLRVELERKALILKIKTENILDFAVDSSRFRTWKQISIDGHTFTLVNLATLGLTDPISFWQQRSDAIEECWGLEKCWCSSLQQKFPGYLRSGRQLGGIDAILRTQGHFIINYTNPKAFNIALQISRNMHTYFYADSEILGVQPTLIPPHSGNRVTIVIGTLSECLGPSPFAIQPDSSTPHRLLVRNHEEYWHQIVAEEGSLGAIWVQPLSDERLELMVWGEDEEGLAQAARLVPTMTGVGVPDFVILDGKAKYRGVDGVLAMGFFDAWWNITSSSYISG